MGRRRPGRASRKGERRGSSGCVRGQPFSPMIIVDTNSAEDPLYDALVTVHGAGEVTRKRLDVGDIFVGEDEREGKEEGEEEGTEGGGKAAKGVCIERKTWADLAASLCDGRLAEQRSRMLDDEGVRYVYAIEGPTVEGWDGFHRGMRCKAMWCALVKMGLRDDVLVVHTRSQSDTAALASYVHAQLRDGGFRSGGAGGAGASSCSGSGTQKRKRDNLSDPASALRAMLSVVPGMSPSRAASVVQRFGTVSKLVSATREEVASVQCGSRKLGPKLAGAIKAVFAAEEGGGGRKEAGGGESA